MWRLRLFGRSWKNFQAFPRLGLNGRSDPEDNGYLLKTLVVEVTFDTDSNSSAYSQAEMEEIERIAKDTLTTKTTMVISKLRIVPKRQR